MTYANLDRLAAALAATSPLAGSLRPGHPREELAAVTVAGHMLPATVAAWFGWRDGTSAGHELLPDGVPLSCAAALRMARLRRDAAAEVAELAGLAHPVGWADGWLPLLAAPQEELCWVADCAQPDGPILRVDHEDPDPVEAFASVAHMVTVLADAYERGVATADADGRVSLDHAAFAALRFPSTVGEQLDVEGQALLRDLRSDDEDAAWEAAEAIEGRLTPAFLPGLAAVAAEAPAPWTRQRAIGLLAQSGASTAAEPVLRALRDDPVPEVRAAAAGGAARFASPQVRDCLLTALDDPASEVVVAAITSLSYLQPPVGDDVIAALEARRPHAEAQVVAAIDYTLGVLRR